MKTFAVLSLLVVAVCAMSPELQELIKSEMKRIGGECKAEMGSSEDDIAPLLKHSLPTTHGGKCFLACLNKKTGLQDASGNVHSADAFLEKIKAIDADYYEKAKTISDKCVVDDHNSDDECETAFALYSCVFEEKNKMGLPAISLD